jgi:hypothetical protein
VNGLQAQDQGARGGARVKRKHLDAYNALENPAHRRTCRRFLNLIRNAVRRLRSTCPQPKPGQARDEHAHDHDQAQSHDPLGHCDTHGGRQKQGIVEKATPALEAALFCVQALREGRPSPAAR